MKLKITFILVLILVFIACKEVQKENELKIYGTHLTTVKENSEIDLKLSSFKDFKKLITRIGYLVCSDSIPQISIQKIIFIK